MFLKGQSVNRVTNANVNYPCQRNRPIPMVFRFNGRRYPTSSDRPTNLGQLHMVGVADQSRQRYERKAVVVRRPHFPIILIMTRCISRRSDFCTDFSESLRTHYNNFSETSLKPTLNVNLFLNAPRVNSVTNDTVMASDSGAAISRYFSSMAGCNRRQLKITIELRQLTPRSVEAQSK